MYVIIRKSIVQKFHMLIEEGHIYLIANLKVIYTDEMYRLIKNDKKIFFLLTTKLKKILKYKICPSVRKFYFINYDKIVNQVDNYIYLSGKNKNYSFIFLNLLLILFN